MSTLSMMAGPYCSIACLHSPSSTPTAPMALLIAATASFGPARSEVPESAIALQPPTQKVDEPTARPSIENSQYCAVARADVTWARARSRVPTGNK